MANDNDMPADRIAERLRLAGLANFGPRNGRLIDLYRQGRALAQRGVVFFTPKRGLSVREAGAMRLGHSDVLRPEAPSVAKANGGKD